MDLWAIGREALATTWRHKALWIFGLFVASAGGGGVGSGGGPGGAAAGAGLPAWAFALIGVAGVLGIAALWMHVVSEGALIDAAARARRADAGGAPRELDVGFRAGIRAGRETFWRVAALKLAAVGLLVVAAVLIGAPALAGFTGLLPGWAAATLVAVIGLAVAPWLLTAWFVYAWALRLAVVDGLPARDAIRSGWAFLHGRVRESLLLLLLAFAGQVAGGFLAAVAVAPGALLGVGIWFATGALVPAVIVGALLALPPAIAVAGATGTFRSTVWTLGFVESRGAARA